MEFTTPSGHVVTLKEHLTFGDRRAIKRVMTDKIHVDVEDGKRKIESVSASIGLDVEEAIFRRVIVDIKLADGTKPKGDLLEVVYDWPENDGEALFDYISENFNTTEETSPKKV